MAVSAPTDKRFRRARVRPARRRWLPGVSRRQVAVAMLCVAVVVYSGIRLVRTGLTSGALTITRIVLDGDSNLSRQDVLGRLDGLRGQNMLAVDLDEWQTKVLESPWVESAAVRRVLPDAIGVRIVERRPMGVGRAGSALYLIDEYGSVIDEYGPLHANFDLPVIDGLDATASRGASGSPVDGVRAALAGRLMASLRSRLDIAGRVSQIDVTDPHDAVVILEGDTALVHVGEEQFVDRLQAYLDIADALRSEVPQIDYVDVRFGERVFVKPHPARGNGRKTAGGE
jgi:cell division septal protein FtsQ